MGACRVGLNGDLGSPHGTIVPAAASSSRMTPDRRGGRCPYTRHGAKLGSVKLLESVRARIRAVDPFHVDIGLAAICAIASAIELASLDHQGDSRPITIAAGVIASASLAFRRRDPLLAAALYGVPALIQAPLDGFLTSDSTVPFVAVILLFYSIGRYAPPKRFPAAAALLATAMLVTLLVEGGLEPEDSFWALFIFGLPTLAGRALRSRVLLQTELREKAERAELERVERARGAVEDERSRIAAELQALVANGLSAMVVQAGTVPRTIDSGDLVRAGAALAAVEETGRDALTEMRRLLGVLRRDGDGLALAPQPGLPRVFALVERIRDGGLPVELDIGTERRRLSPGIDLTAYRVLEDSLETAADRGATAAEVKIRWTADELRLQVTDDRDGDLSDRLPGLRERVGLYGGHLRAEHRDDGAFRLRLTLPIEVAG
jgi:signal transduction histidine kinase